LREAAGKVARPHQVLEGVFVWDEPLEVPGQIAQVGCDALQVVPLADDLTLGETDVAAG
jgi:hypothetical protein